MRPVAFTTPTTAGMPYSRATTAPCDIIAHLHHERARGQEEWSPTRIGRWSHQNFAGFEPRADRRPDHVRNPARDARRCRRATYGTVRRGGDFGLRVGAVGEKDGRYVAAALLAPIDGAAVNNGPAEVFASDRTTPLRQRQKERVVR